MTFVAALTVFVLAMFLGWELIHKVPPNLHTPLMSGSNAVSGISLIGAIVGAGSGQMDLAAWLGFAAVIFATLNVVGGFWVTDKMLQNFKTKRGSK